jgi:fructosamine-3-kinase
MSEDLVRRLVHEELGVEARVIGGLTGGEVGRVFRAETDGGSYVVKLVAGGREPAFADESPSQRVYSSRWSNLRPAHALLRAEGVATPRLLASGERDGSRYAILDYLDGDPDDRSPEWFACVGASLGQLHRITRSFQGWVDMQQPYAESWSNAFAGSLRSWLVRATPHLPTALHAAVAARAREMAAALDDPPAFVFSHTDGFQGVLKKHGGVWTLLGVVDIEDHQFTDQRFVLAGFELSHAIEDRTVPAAFWSAYAAQAPVSPSYAAFRPLFQIYDLLVWSWVFRDRADLLASCVRQLEQILDPPPRGEDREVAPWFLIRSEE